MCDFRKINYLKAIPYGEIKNLTAPGVYFIIATGSFYIYFDGKSAYQLGKTIKEV